MSKLHTENIPFYTRDLNTLDFRISGIGLRTKPDTKGQLYNPPWIPESHLQTVHQYLWSVQARFCTGGLSYSDSSLLSGLLSSAAAVTAILGSAWTWLEHPHHLQWVSSGPYLFSGRTTGSPPYPSGSLGQEASQVSTISFPLWLLNRALGTKGLTEPVRELTLQAQPQPTAMHQPSSSQQCLWREPLLEAWPVAYLSLFSAPNSVEETWGGRESTYALTTTNKTVLKTAEKYIKN